MNKLPLATAALAAVAALALWLLALYLEDDSHWVPPVASSSQVSGEGAGRITPDSAVAIDVPACEVVEDRLRSTVAESRACVSDRDCAVFDYGYPIDCMTSVARAEISTLRQEFSEYHASCEYRVYFDCPTGAAQRHAVCREQQCTIDLVTIDSLQDDTLDHLGLDP